MVILLSVLTTITPHSFLVPTIISLLADLLTSHTQAGSFLLLTSKTYLILSFPLFQALLPVPPL